MSSEGMQRRKLLSEIRLPESALEDLQDSTRIER